MIPDTTTSARTGSRSDTRTFLSREVVITGAIVACAPLVLLLFNRDWFLTRETYIDPWQYVGFFQHYLNPDFLRGAYKMARLPWILAGFSVHHLLPPLAAAYVLHGLFLCGTVLMLFAALYVLMRRLTLAAVVATVFGFYTHVHGSGGWDYHNTAGGALYLLTFTLLALPAVIAGRTLPMMLTGVAAALAVHTNITLVNFLPVLAFVHLWLVKLDTGSWPGPRTLAIRGGWALLGAVLVTVLLGLINWMVGREFFFFGSLLDLVTHFVSDPGQYQEAYWRPWNAGWLLAARDLALPAAVFIAGAVSSIRLPSTGRADGIATALVWQFLVMTVVWTAWQAAGQTALDRVYMAYPLQPACFIALGGLLVRTWPDACERHRLAMVTGTAILCAVTLQGALDWYFQTVVAFLGSSIVIVGVLLFSAALLVYFVRPGITTTIVLIVTLAMGNRLEVYRPENYAMTDPCKAEPSIYSALLESEAWLEEVDPTYSRIRTWFEEQAVIHPRPGCNIRMRAIGRAMTVVSWRPYVTASLPMPPVDDVPVAAIQSLANDEAMLAIVSSTTANLDRWNQRLERAGLASTEVARHTGRVIDSEFTIHVWKVEHRVPTGLTFAAPIIALTNHTPPEINVYGTPKGRVTTEDDRVVFTPTDARDHVSYPFVKLSPLASDAWARVVVESAGKASSSCHVVVQAEGFTTLATLGCSSTTRFVRIPMNTQGIRVYVADAAEQAFILPTRIELALSEPR